MTAVVPTDRIKQSVMVRVPGLTDALFSLELFNVMDEFFKRTSAWRYKTEIALEAGAGEYPLPVPADALFVRMIGVTLNGTPVPSLGEAIGSTQSSFGVMTPEMSFPDGDASFTPDASDLVGTLFTYAVYRSEYITLTGAPDQQQSQQPLKITMVLTIAPPCCAKDCGDWMLEDWMYDMFYQDWYDGVLSRLYGMPAKPWSSPTLQLYHGKRFRQALAYRKQEANRGFTYGVPGFRFPKVGGWI